MSKPLSATLRTYGIQREVLKDTRPATCEEAECEAFAGGFKIVCDLSTERGRAQAAYITDRMNQGEPAHLKRAFVKLTDTPGTLTFVFPPETRCFVQHRVRNGRPAAFVRHNGGSMLTRTGRTITDLSGRCVMRPVDWVESLHEDLDPVLEARKREGYDQPQE